MELAEENLSLSEWVEVQNERELLCHCGCHGLLTISPRHRREGLPSYIPGHQRMVMTSLVIGLREQGFLLVSDVARELGCARTTVRRLANRLFGRGTRYGKMNIRVFTPDEVAQLRAAWEGRRRGAT